MFAKARNALQRVNSGGFLWYIPDRTSTPEAHKVRSAARRLLRQRWPMLLRPLAATFASVAWPWFAYRETNRLLAASNREALPPNARHKAWFGAVRHNLPAAEYAAFGLWHPQNTRADECLGTLEASSVTAHLTARSVADLCGDKIAFAAFCAANSPLPVVPTLARYRDGTHLPTERPAVLPQQDLISKPVRASQGRAVEAWHWTGAGFRRHNTPSAKALSPEQLHATLAAQSRAHSLGLLLQPALDTHPDLPGLGGTGVPVARIITARWPDGRVELLNAMLQKPQTGHLTTHGGPYRSIDLDSGALAQRPPPPHIFPSATDDPAFDGLALPDWSNCCKHLLHLHGIVPDQAPLLGWDVIFTPDGPTILEANTTLAPYFFQLAEQHPAAGGKWVSLLASYLP